MEEYKKDFEELEYNLCLKFDSFKKKIKPDIYHDGKQFNLISEQAFYLIKKFRFNSARVFTVLLNNESYVFDIYCIHRILNLNDMRFCPYIAFIDDDLKGFFSVIHDKSAKIFGFIIATNISFSKIFKL